MLCLVGMASCNINTSGKREQTYRYYAVVNNAVVNIKISKGMFNVIKQNGIDSVRIQKLRDQPWELSEYTVMDYEQENMKVITIPSSDIHESK